MTIASNRAGPRLARLLALVPYLLARPGARLRDVAASFGISEKQLRDDLNLLWVCGLPGHTPGDLIDMSLDGDRVTLFEPQSIERPLRLTSDEALAVLVALRALADVPGLVDRDALDRALTKLTEACGAGIAPDTLTVTLADEAASDHALAVVRGGLERGRRLHLSYYTPARDEVTERDVDPMRLLLVEGHSYLEGWCRRAEGVRLFRLDRVVAVDELDAPAQPPAGARVRDLESGLFTPSPDDPAVVIELAPAARWVADYYPCDEVTETGGGGLRVRLRTTDESWVRRLALRLGPAARVVDPPGVALRVRAEARAALAHYRET